VGVDAVVQLIIRKRVPWILIGVIAGVGVLLVLLVKLARNKIKGEK
jgi:hypothetical protein